MGRMLKEGLSFFPLDVEYFDNDKVVDLTFEKKLVSEVVFIHSLAIIYHEGYFIKTTPERFAKKVFISLHGKHTLTIKEVTEIVYLMADIGLLDKGMMEKEVITSKAIQEQYYASTLRRKDRQRVYWLLNDEDEAKVDKRLNCRHKTGSSGISVYKNEVEGDLCEQHGDDNRQNKNNNNNDNENDYDNKNPKDRDDKDDKGDKGQWPGKLNYYTSCLIDSKILSAYEPYDIDRFNDLFERSYGENDDKELFNRCFRYTRDYVKRNKDKIADIYAFFERAFTENLSKMEGYDERMQDFFKGWNDVLGGIHGKD